MLDKKLSQLILNGDLLFLMGWGLTTIVLKPLEEGPTDGDVICWTIIGFFENGDTFCLKEISLEYELKLSKVELK